MHQLYSLRKDFTIIGVTGKIGSGCSEIARRLSKEDFNENLSRLFVSETSDIDQLKLNNCVNYLKAKGNWYEYRVIQYKNVLLFHLFYESVKSSDSIEGAIKLVLDYLILYGEENRRLKRIGKNDNNILNLLKESLNTNSPNWYNFLKHNMTCDTLRECLDSHKESDAFFTYYFYEFSNVANSFYDQLNEWDISKRALLIHDMANDLRERGSLISVQSVENRYFNHIYTVAETINRLIKNWKYNQGNKKTKIVIDSLKNSLELMFFKEKYSAFYTIAANKAEIERKDYLLNLISDKYGRIYNKEQIKTHTANLLSLSENEYKGNEVNKGKFSSPDIENCIQKSDYHIFFTKYTKNNSQEFDKEAIQNSSSLNKLEQKQLITELENYPQFTLTPQLVKLLALIQQPGIVTPTAYERIMQFAYNAKTNSGCISRQVGAVVTDTSYSIKAVGWNDIPRFQIPCSLRSATDLINDKNLNHFSDFEKGLSGNYKDKSTFKDNLKEDLKDKDLSKLNGRNCAFCFKTHHNAYEGEKNQVHTRSLHAEENAMLQITKYGGQGLKDGNLFTTASPCELCSKKAFQLGIKRIFYIDPYPGIATKHILKNSKKEGVRPSLFMFQGAVGKAFHKLYEPFMSYKDELSIIADIKPKIYNEAKVQRLTSDKSKQQKILDILNDQD